MAIVIKTATPNRLLAAIKAEIDSNKIETWSYDLDGDFTQTPPQWNLKAWLRPSVGAGHLTFNIFPPQNTQMSRVVYAVYHGRFIEMVLSHFDTDIESAYASALPVRPDRVNTIVIVR